MTDTKHSPFSLTVLGSASCVPSPVRFPSSYLLSLPAERFLVDLGSGALQRLSQTDVSYNQIDRVFVSHGHPDHLASLLPLLQALNHTPGYTHNRALSVYAPKEVEKILESSFEIYPKLRPLFPFRFVRLSDGDKIEGNGWKGYVRSLKHSAETMGLRIEVGDRTFTYSADSGRCDELIELARDADLAVLECSFRSSRTSATHLTTSDVGLIAKESRVRKLLLTHFYPEVLELPKEKIEEEVRSSGFSGELLLAEDLMKVNVV